jgi:predicted nuclease of predicted toxin-antitoxin system
LRIKLDENLGRRCEQLFANAGHDTATIPGEKLSGASDSEVISRCRDEVRGLITLDLDFGNPLLFKPSEYRGIAVLRAHRPIEPRELEELCLTLIGALTREDLDRKLWIVEHGRIRIYQEEPAE